MRRRRIHVGLILRRHRPPLRKKPLPERPRPRRLVPIETRRKPQPLRHLQPQRIDVRQINQEPGQRDARLRLNPELRQLLDKVHLVPAHTRQPQHLRPRALRRQHLRREIRAPQRELRRPQHPPPIRLDHLRRLRLQRVTETEIHRDEIPVLPPRLGDHLAASRRHRMRVIRPMTAHRRAEFRRELRHRRRRDHHRPRLLPRHLLHRQRHRRHRQIGNRIHPLIVPLPRDRPRHIRLVLRVRMHDLDRQPQHRRPEILDRHLRRRDRPGPPAARIRPRLIRQYPNADRPRLYPRLCPRPAPCGGSSPGQHRPAAKREAH